MSAFYAANFTVLLTLVFLAHQTLVSLDAVVRALVRRMVTRERLLEWETAAEAEAGTRRTPVDRYLDWMPFLAIAIGLLVWRVRPHSRCPRSTCAAVCGHAANWSLCGSMSRRSARPMTFPGRTHYFFAALLFTLGAILPSSVPRSTTG